MIQSQRLGNVGERSVSEKKMHNLNLLRTLAWDTAFQIALRDNSKEVREEPGYIAVFLKNKQTKTTMLWNIKEFLFVLLTYFF